jgi:hypothetical protein
MWPSSGLDVRARCPPAQSPVEVSRMAKKIETAASTEGYPPGGVALLVIFCYPPLIALRRLGVTDRWAKLS